MSARQSSEWRARKAALRATLAERKAAARADLARRRAALRSDQDPRRKRRWWAVLLALLLLFLLRDCRCDDEVEGPVAELPAQAAGEGGAESAQAPIKGRVARRDRPSFATEQPDALPWIDALRLQVAARSPRLAACFVGAPRPGALRWTAAVEPDLGRVSDQALEPMLATDSLTRAQRDCALGVLAAPDYRLDGGDERSTPARVGLVIEF